MTAFNIIVLSGGSSSRFAPLQEKNLYPFLGKPLIRYQVEKLQTILEPQHIVVIANPDNQERITQSLAELGVEVLVQPEHYEGQAGGVRTGLEKLNSELPVLIVNANDVFEDSLLEDFDKIQNELVSDQQNLLTGYQTMTYFPGGYLVLNENEEVVEVIEKPAIGEEPSDVVRLVFDFFWSGGHLMDSLNEAASAKDDVYEVAISSMMQTKPFRLLRYSGEWAALKFPWHVLGVMQHFLNTISEQKLSDEAFVADTAVIRGKVVVEAGAKVFDGATIVGPAYIGKDCIIGNNALVRDSMIGEGSVVGYATEVARSYWHSEVWTHKNYIGDSIIESNVSFASHAVTANLRFDERNIKVNVKEEPILSSTNKLGAIVGGNVRIGVGALIMPGTKIGNNSVVGAGVVLEQDLEANTYVKTRQQLDFAENKLNIAELSRDKIKEKLHKASQTGQTKLSSEQESSPQTER